MNYRFSDRQDRPGRQTSYSESVPQSPIIEATLLQKGDPLSHGKFAAEIDARPDKGYDWRGTYSVDKGGYNLGLLAAGINGEPAEGPFELDFGGANVREIVILSASAKAEQNGYEAYVQGIGRLP